MACTMILMRRRPNKVFGLDEDVNGIGAAIPEIEADTAIGKLSDGCGDGTGGEVPADWENDGVARTAKAAIENKFIAIEAVSHRGCVRF